MKDFCVKDIVRAVGGSLLCGDENVQIDNFATNSGKAEPGLMFAPIVGERVDGHKYIESAFDCGASASLTQNEEAVAGLIDKWRSLGIQPKPIVLAEDSVRAMQLTAKEYESRLSLNKVGVTGSVGKTTTKEMIACALSGGLKVFKTAGNANSQIGVPVTIMNIAPDDEAAVIEMGMSEKGEMKRLATLLSLNAAVMTNIGVSHIEQLGSQENILREKWHITDAITEGGCIFLNGDDVLLKECADLCRNNYAGVFGKEDNRKLMICTFGHSADCDYRAENEYSDENGVGFDMLHGDVRIPVRLNVLGAHNVNNALVALAVAEFFGVDLRAAVKALEGYTGVAMRQHGTVLCTIADKDKEEALPLIRRFYQLGFNIEATSGTAAFLKRNGIRTHALAKISDGSDEIPNALRQGHIAYVINTRDPGANENDGIQIRQIATEHNVTLFTALDTIKVLLDVLEETTLTISTIDAK